MKKINLGKYPKASFPKNVKPMLATLTEKAFDSSDWIFEIKWDGYRMISGLNKGEITLTSRNFISYTRKFPTIVKSLKLIKVNAVLDGEIVVIDDAGVSNFQLLQNYQRTGKGNIVYYLFDIIWLEGHDLRNIPLLKRKELLSEILPEKSDIRLSEHITKDGKKLFEAAKKQNLEGIIAKLSGSYYYEGARTKLWLKIKTEKRQEAIICGYTGPQGSRKYFGSLILGLYEGGKLTYIGNSGTGFNETSLKQIYDKLKKYVQSECPFEIRPKITPSPKWVIPKLICEIKFSEWTSDGHMRHPVFEGMREDKAPEEIIVNDK